MLEVILSALRPWLWPGLSAAAAVTAAYFVYRGLLALTRRLSSPEAIARMFLDASAQALGTVLCLLALNVVLQTAPAPLPGLDPVQHLATLLLILSMTWAAVRGAAAIGDVIVSLHPVRESEWRRARKIETQTRFLVRGLNVLVLIVGLGAALMTFDSVQQIGASLLASAGIGGIILGFAARPVLENLLAGFQIALTEPFRIDDVVHVQGEWCWVEEVTATYVTLRVWDRRRLVVPLQWFIANPFENWSRNTADLMGTVLLWLDYMTPLEPLREEFSRLLNRSAQWDGEIETVQIVDAGDRAMQVRFLMSARDSTQLWDLRCAVREGLVSFVQRHYPECLPRTRAQLLESSDRSPGSAAPA